MARVSLARRVLPLVLLSAAARADAADPVAVRVGALTVPVSEVARRLSAMPSFQVLALGPSPGAIRHAFVETMLVPELLLSEEAERRSLGRDPRVNDQVKDALRRALVRKFRADLAAGGVSDVEARAYYDAHPDDY